MDNQVKQMFNKMALNAEYGKASPNQGFGALGEWPAEGEHECWVTGVEFSDAEFKQTDGQMFDGFTVQFKYELFEDPDRPQPLSWIGQPFRLPVDSTKLTHDGTITRVRIECERLAGHCKTLLQRNPTDIGTDLELIDKMLNEGEQSVVCKVRCQYSKRGDRTYRTEFLQELLDGAAGES